MKLFLAVIALFFTVAFAVDLTPLKAAPKSKALARSPEDACNPNPCGSGETCCLTPGGAGCCPLTTACCCPDQAHCCGSGYQCSCSGTCPGSSCTCTGCATSGGTCLPN